MCNSCQFECISCSKCHVNVPNNYINVFFNSLFLIVVVVGTVGFISTCIYLTYLLSSLLNSSGVAVLFDGL